MVELCDIARAATDDHFDKTPSLWALADAQQWCEDIFLLSSLWRLPKSEPLPPTDLDLIRRQLPNTTFLPLTVTDTQLLIAGEQLGLDMPVAQSTPLKHRCRASEQAMALWALFTAGFCRKPEAQVLFAAFRAWRALQSARPITF